MPHGFKALMDDWGIYAEVQHAGPHPYPYRTPSPTRRASPPALAGV